MEGEDAIDDAIHRLTVLECIGNEADITRGCRPMQPQVRNYTTPTRIQSESSATVKERERTFCCDVVLCVGLGGAEYGDGHGRRVDGNRTLARQGKSGSGAPLSFEQKEEERE